MPLGEQYGQRKPYDLGLALDHSLHRTAHPFDDGGQIVPRSRFRPSGDTPLARSLVIGRHPALLGLSPSPLPSRGIPQKPPGRFLAARSGPLPVTAASRTDSAGGHIPHSCRRYRFVSLASGQLATTSRLLRPSAGEGPPPAAEARHAPDAGARAAVRRGRSRAAAPS
ncbi:hypothetical protein STXM2123_2135 [Streptomyces sp. F-3]|nr:hypothetical protein STXM2123_2135 [Streptomyces sp. F-3]